MFRVIGGLVEDSQSFYVQDMEPALAQRLDALKEANRIRGYRARLKAQIASGACPWHVTLWDPDCESMLLVDALRAKPMFGRAKIGRLLLRSQIPASKVIGSLTVRQRRELKENVGQ